MNNNIKKMQRKINNNPKSNKKDLQVLFKKPDKEFASIITLITCNIQVLLEGLDKLKEYGIKDYNLTDYSKKMQHHLETKSESLFKNMAEIDQQNYFTNVKLLEKKWSDFVYDNLELKIIDI